MSILKDIIDAKDSVQQEISKVEGVLNSPTSISKAANKGILQFPVLVSSALSPKDANLVSKALERQYVSFVRVLTSVNSVTDAKDITSYLTKFHQNDILNSVIKENMMDDPIPQKQGVATLPDFSNTQAMQTSQVLEFIFAPESSDNMEDGSVFDQDSDDEDFDDLGDNDDGTDSDGDEIDIVNIDDATLDEEMLMEELLTRTFPKIMHYPGQRGYTVFVNENTICNAYLNRKDNNGNGVGILITPAVKIRNYSDVDMNRLSEEMRLSNVNELAPRVLDINTDILNDKFKPLNYIVVGENKTLQKKYNGFLAEADSSNPADDNSTEGRGNEKHIYDGLGTAKESSMVPKDNLSDNDVKKSNELSPSMLHVRTFFKTKDGNLAPVDYMIGVKSVMHVIKSESMISNLVGGLKKGKLIFKTVKLTSGEISFWKDFLFALKDIKNEVRVNYKESKWWNILTRRKRFSKMLQAVKIGKQLAPNASIVISMDDVAYIKNQYGIDFMDMTNIKEIVSKYFLLSFAILDPSTETSYFYFDGNYDLQQLSYSALEKENSNASKDVQQIMQVLGKM